MIFSSARAVVYPDEPSTDDILSRHILATPVPGVGHEIDGVLASAQARAVYRQEIMPGEGLLAASAYRETRPDVGDPVVLSVTTTIFAVDSVDHFVTMPLVTIAGEGLLVVLTTDGDSSVTLPGEWDSVYSSSITSTLRGSVFALIADGTEGGTTVNFVTSVAEKGAAQVYRITNWNGTLAGIHNGTAVTGSAGYTADLPAVTAPWGPARMLCIGVLHTSTSQTVSSAPAGYTDFIQTSSGASTTDAQCITARKFVNAETEDPGVFTMSGSGASKIYNTLLICPANAGMYYERFNITRSGTTLWAGLYTSQPYQVPDENITRAIIVIHGKSLDASGYSNVVRKNMKDYLGKAIVVAPFFERNIARADIDQLFWGSSWPELGRSSSLLPWRISSGEVLDLLMASLYSTFPNLTSIVISGHSAGGQITQRAACVFGDRDDVAFLASAPSSYAYPGPHRYSAGSWGIPVSPATYDDWKYGFSNLSTVTYVDAIGAHEMCRRFFKAKITYMVGELDNDPASSSLDVTANAMVQGAQRREHQDNFYNYLKYYHAWRW